MSYKLELHPLLMHCPKVWQNYVYWLMDQNFKRVEDDIIHYNDSPPYVIFNDQSLMTLFYLKYGG